MGYLSAVQKKLPELQGIFDKNGLKIYLENTLGFHQTVVAVLSPGRYNLF